VATVIKGYYSFGMHYAFTSEKMVFKFSYAGFEWVLKKHW